MVSFFVGGFSDFRLQLINASSSFSSKTCLFERHQARLFPGSSATEGRQGNMLPLYFIAFAWEVSFLSYSLFIDRSMLRILKRDTCRKDSRTFPVDCLNLSIFFSSQRCIMAVKTIDIEGKWVVKCSHWKDLRK